MASKTEKSVIYHIPKCGGIWVKEAMRRSGLRYDRCRHVRAAHPFSLKREHAPPDMVRDGEKVGRFSFCFVRHPLGWLRSFWAFRVKTSWLDYKFPADRLWDDMFDIFVDNLVDAYPQEHLADDLVTALTLAGEDFDEERLRTTPWRNIAAAGRRFRKLCVLSERTEQRALEADAWVVETFYA
jgi:hypothetical protein